VRATSAACGGFVEIGIFDEVPDPILCHECHSSEPNAGGVPVSHEATVEILEGSLEGLTVAVTFKF
jgi:hypothetical protein